MTDAPITTSMVAEALRGLVGQEQPRKLQFRLFKTRLQSTLTSP